jgi:uncharacterized membrane protein
MLIFIHPVSSWLSSFDNIDATAEPTRAKGGTYYTLLSILNLPLFGRLLFRQGNTRFVNQLYAGLFVLLSILLIVVNPMDVLTTAYNLWTIIGVTAAVFFALKYLSNGMFKQLFLVFLVMTLGICGETVLTNQPRTYTIYYMLFYLAGYLWNVIVLDPELFKRIKSRLYELAMIVYEHSPGFSWMFVFEVLLIVLLLYGRTWLKQYYGGDLIVHNPCELNKMSSYPVSNPYQYNYTLSFWVYLDATSRGFSQSSNEYTDIVLYGDNTLIAYNSSLNTLRTVMKNKSKKTFYDMHDIPLQKWNHVVLSYANGTLDLFLNGELQKSTVAVPETSSQEVIVGAEQGAQGRLCTLMFYNRVLTMDEIQALYTQFKDKNPPTV